MSGPLNKTLSSRVRQKAYELGFDLVGIAPARPLTAHLPVLEQWCSQGMNGDMAWICNDKDKRINPSRLFPGVKSIIVTGLNYYSEKKTGFEGLPEVSRYAYGEDYHDVILRKLNLLLDFIVLHNSQTVGKAYVDTSPVLEKAWAREAGLGWPGKHSILINESIGSFFFLGILMLDTELDYDDPLHEDKCGSCRICIGACPTGAINEDRTIDARKCISFITVERKGPIPGNMAPSMGGRLFGCDRCQEVCPWNRKAKPSMIPEFRITPGLAEMKIPDWENLSEDQFRKLFGKSPVGRRKYGIFRENIDAILGSSE